MECKRCKKECLESELKNGYCAECFNKCKGDENKLKNINNRIADYFRIWSYSLIVIGIILGGVAFFSDLRSFYFGNLYTGISFGFSIF